MEKIHTSEVQPEKALRQDDLRKFWEGFKTFWERDPDLKTEVENHVGPVFYEIYSSSREGLLFERAVEAACLFTYGVVITKRLRTELTDKVPIPKIVIFAENSGPAHYTAWKKGEVIWTSLGVGIGWLTGRKRTYTGQVEMWENEPERTVSEYIPDWKIVQIVLAGCEEYAHELFVNFKKPALKEAEWKNTGRSDVKYHARDDERRALVWQKALLNKYFPHWAEPTSELIEKVAATRIKKQNRKKWFRF